MRDRLKIHFSSLYPPFKEKMEALAQVLGPDWGPYCGFRSMETQSKLYASGRAVPGKIVTLVKPGYSFHNFGLACDWGYFKAGFDPWEHDKWQEFGEAVTSIKGLQWGGHFVDFKDNPHVQLRIKHPISELLDIFNKSGLQSVWRLLEG